MFCEKKKSVHRIKVIKQKKIMKGNRNCINVNKMNVILLKLYKMKKKL